MLPYKLQLQNGKYVFIFDDEDNQINISSNNTQLLKPSFSKENDLLLNAAKCGDLETIINLILSCKASVNSSNWLGFTIYHYAAKYNHPKLIEKIEMNVNVRSKLHRTPLQIAAYYGNTECVKVLLIKNASVDLVDSLQMTALHWAAQKGYLKIVQMLLLANANPLLFNKYNKLPHDLAFQDKHLDVYNFLKNFIDNRSVPPLDFGNNIGSHRMCVNEIQTNGSSATGKIHLNKPKIDVKIPKNRVSDICTEVNESVASKKETLETRLPGANVIKKLFEEHDIKELSVDESPMLNTAVKSDHKLVLTDAGKLALNLQHPDDTLNEFLTLSKNYRNIERDMIFNENSFREKDSERANNELENEAANELLSTVKNIRKLNSKRKDIKSLFSLDDYLHLVKKVKYDDNDGMRASQSISISGGIGRPNLQQIANRNKIMIDPAPNNDMSNAPVCDNKIVITSKFRERNRNDSESTKSLKQQLFKERIIVSEQNKNFETNMNDANHKLPQNNQVSFSNNSGCLETRNVLTGEYAETSELSANNKNNLKKILPDAEIIKKLCEEHNIKEMPIDEESPMLSTVIENKCKLVLTDAGKLALNLNPDDALSEFFTLNKNYRNVAEKFDFNESGCYNDNETIEKTEGRRRRKISTSKEFSDIRKKNSRPNEELTDSSPLANTSYSEVNNLKSVRKRIKSADFATTRRDNFSVCGVKKLVRYGKRKEDVISNLEYNSTLPKRRLVNRKLSAKKKSTQIINNNKNNKCNERIAKSSLTAAKDDDFKDQEGSSADMKVLFEKHGIKELPVDDEPSIITCAIKNGQKIVLTEAGKLALKLTMKDVLKNIMLHSDAVRNTKQKRCISEQQACRSEFLSKHDDDSDAENDKRRNDFSTSSTSSQNHSKSIGANYVNASSVNNGCGATKNNFRSNVTSLKTDKRDISVMREKLFSVKTGISSKTGDANCEQLKRYSPPTGKAPINFPYSNSARDDPINLYSILDDYRYLSNYYFYNKSKSDLKDNFSAMSDCFNYCLTGEKVVEKSAHCRNVDLNDLSSNAIESDTSDGDTNSTIINSEVYEKNEFSSSYSTATTPGISLIDNLSRVLANSDVTKSSKLISADAVQCADESSNKVKLSNDIRSNIGNCNGTNFVSADKSHTDISKRTLPSSFVSSDVEHRFISVPKDAVPKLFIKSNCDSSDISKNCKGSSSKNKLDLSKTDNRVKLNLPSTGDSAGRQKYSPAIEVAPHLSSVHDTTPSVECQSVREIEVEIDGIKYPIIEMELTDNSPSNSDSLLPPDEIIEEVVIDSDDIESIETTSSSAAESFASDIDTAENFNQLRNDCDETTHNGGNYVNRHNDPIILYEQFDHLRLRKKSYFLSRVNADNAYNFTTSIEGSDKDIENYGKRVCNDNTEGSGTGALKKSFKPIGRLIRTNRVCER